MECKERSKKFLNARLETPFKYSNGDTRKLFTPNIGEIIAAIDREE